MGCLASMVEPESYDEAVNSEYTETWMSAIKDEINSLELNQTGISLINPTINI